jgi:hypothetical protein
MTTLKPQMEALERRVLPSSIAANQPPALPIATPAAASTSGSSTGTLTSPAGGATAQSTAGLPTVVLGGGAGQAFGFPTTANANGQSIETQNQAEVDDTFQGGNLDVFDGPAGQAPARVARSAPNSGGGVSVGSTSVGGALVVVQLGSQYDPYRYRPLSGWDIVGEDGALLPAPGDSLVPGGPLVPAGSAGGADHTLEPSPLRTPGPKGQ